ncbi:MAG TPA: SDR family NAD(P)-dependent oxidoreductase, partial [Novosphingobium sp.]|nr:SDR family NAD(P)-dependent oxidoreductase [Novosphingobium sp.]HQQ09104.1 SDR family NAD(P)-dependent oxidoreductase [Novosphingobium sp.]
MTIHPAIAPGNIAVITGGANGIGLAAARRLAGMGLRVVVADRDREQLALARGALGEGHLAIETDVADPASVAALAAEVAVLGPVSVLMNNAGVG